MTRASAAAFWLSLTIIVSLGLYHTSYQVDDMEQQLHVLNSKIEEEQKNIHILKAEWDFLSNPTRIASAAQKYLHMQPTEPKQLAKIGRIASLFPTNKESAYASARQSGKFAYNRPAANTPRSSDSDTSRVNTRITIQKTEHKTPTGRTLSWRKAIGLTYADNSVIP